MLQRVAVCCSVLIGDVDQLVGTQVDILRGVLQRVAVCCSVLIGDVDQLVGTTVDILRCVAACCSVSQCVAVC